MARLLTAAVLLICVSAVHGADVDPDHAALRMRGLEVFRSSVRKILVDKCLSCHGGESTEGKLDLATQEGLLNGGERGPAAVIARGDKSLLTRLVRHQQPPYMPKDDEPLTEKEVAALVQWIDLGAPYDEPLIARSEQTARWIDRRIDPQARGFWAFQPLRRQPSPRIEDSTRWARTPIDLFLLEKLQAAQIAPNGSVGKAALIRRVMFDLTGLPPTPDEIQEFLHDERPDAYERLLDRLLANPHYGERWGRYWLDLARFAESHGFEHDYDRPSAYHYRDFVIQALNSGMPYDQFIRWQLAGDELAPQDRLALMATGFLAAGVHSTQITKNEVEKHRYDEMDDMLSTLGTSVLGLSVGCARCHDHKFDPIPQADYYRLLASFTTTIRSEVDLDFDPEGYRRIRDQFDRSHEPYVRAVRDYEAGPLAQRLAEWTASPAASEQPDWLIPEQVQFQSHGGATFTRQPDGSWLSTGTSPANDHWTVELTTRLRDIRGIRLEALAHPSLVKAGPGRAGNGNFALSEFSVTIRPESGDAAPVTLSFDQARATFEQKGLPVAAAIDGNPQSAWAVDPEFGKDHAAVFTTAPFGFEGGTRITVTMRFNNNVHHSIGRPRISLTSRSDLPPAAGGAGDESIRNLLRRPASEWTADQRQRLLDWFKPRDPGWKERDDRRAAHAATAPQPQLKKVLVATEGLPPIKLHTQAESEFLKETHFLRRGEPNHKEAVASQGFLQVLLPQSAQVAQFQVAPPAGWRTSYQRTSLANWLLDPQAGAGHLAARVMVNRLWQHHLGQGIVASPSDFGLRGERPTHPELLDELAGILIDRGWDLKMMHRLIMTSAAYRQSGDVDAARLAVDRENHLLWHRPRHRLEAEAIRDAVLAVSGQLDDRLYGPGTLDENHRRRSIYFTVKRSQLMPSMTVFDAPDGTTPVADRPQTTIAPQALLLMNHPQVRESCRRFAASLAPQAATSLDDAISRAYLAAIGRAPTAQELEGSRSFLQAQSASYAPSAPQTGLSSALVDFCQVLLCLNEFVYTE